jgi:hypothetical protein
MSVEQEITREEDDTDMSADGERVSNNVTVEKWGMTNGLGDAPTDKPLVIDGTKDNLEQNETVREGCNAPEMERNIMDLRAEGDIVKQEGRGSIVTVTLDTAEDSDGDNIPMIARESGISKSFRSFVRSPCASVRLFYRAFNATTIDLNFLRARDFVSWLIIVPSITPFRNDGRRPERRGHRARPHIHASELCSKVDPTHTQSAKGTRRR